MISLTFLTLGMAAVPASSSSAATRVAVVHAHANVPRSPMHASHFNDGYRPTITSALPSDCYNSDIWCTGGGRNHDLVQEAPCPYNPPETWYKYPKSGQKKLTTPFNYVLNGCTWRLWLHKIDSDGTVDAQCFSPGTGGAPNSDMGTAPHDLQITGNPDNCP